MVTDRDRKSFRSRRKIPQVAQTTGTADAFDPRDPLRGELPHIQVFKKDELNPLT